MTASNPKDWQILGCKAPTNPTSTPVGVETFAHLPRVHTRMAELSKENSSTGNFEAINVSTSPLIS